MPASSLVGVEPLHEWWGSARSSSACIAAQLFSELCDHRGQLCQRACHAPAGNILIWLGQSACTAPSGFSAAAGSRQTPPAAADTPVGGDRRPASQAAPCARSAALLRCSWLRCCSGLPQRLRAGDRWCLSGRAAACPSWARMPRPATTVRAAACSTKPPAVEWLCRGREAVLPLKCLLRGRGSRQPGGPQVTAGGAAAAVLPLSCSVRLPRAA